MKTERIAVYGKGGVGKSVVATALSAHFGQAGRRVLHIGCDPKRDSAVRLLDSGQVPTVLDTLAQNPNLASTNGILHEGRHGIVCCESGGPEPGQGCGGRGVARTLEFLDEMEVMASGSWDVITFDVLGDVVCGGFAAPLRQGFAEKVIIVISEEPMAMLAANNISKAINTYWRNGVRLAGFVANVKADDADVEALERFAAALSTCLLAVVPRDPLVLEAERLRKTVIEHAPQAAAAQSLSTLADELVATDTAALTPPTPLDDEAFFSFIKT